MCGKAKQAVAAPLKFKDGDLATLTAPSMGFQPIPAGTQVRITNEYYPGFDVETVTGCRKVAGWAHADALEPVKAPYVPQVGDKVTVKEDLTDLKAGEVLRVVRPAGRGFELESTTGCRKRDGWAAAEDLQLVDDLERLK